MSIKINRYGIQFIHAKGTQYEDDMIWVWWWQRKLNKGKAFYSLSFEVTYSSLKELDREWLNFIETYEST